METEEQEIKVPADLGMRLTDWHSSMWDPVYAVSSSTLAKRPVPTSVFRDALANMESCLGSPGHEEHQQEVREIVSAMKSVLGEAETRETVINAMARYFWAASWADEMEERGDSVCGEITHMAPATPDEAVALAKKKLEKFEEINGKTLEQVIKAERPSDIYDYGGLMAGNFLGYGIDSMGDYETPWCESSELSHLVPEESED